MRPVVRPASSPEKAVEAEKFVLRDANGRSRAVLTVSADGSPVLALSDQDGTTRATLAVSADGQPGLALYDEDGRVSWSAS